MDYERIKGEIISIFPPALRREIEALLLGNRKISEIRIRKDGRCSLVLGGRTIPLVYTARNDIDAIFTAVCRGAPYAYRDNVKAGFVPFIPGVRVGVAGRAAYDGDRLVGISDVSSLVFRIPSGECDFSAEILDIWRRSKGGLLIFSAPGGGKTTALRSLASSLSRGKEARRVVVVDERDEIFTDELRGFEVDTLSGYKRAFGISLATRSLNPEVIITDEISADDSGAISAAANCGVPIIATAHAADTDELCRREDIMSLIKRGVFRSFAGIFRSGGRFVCREVFLGEDERLF